MGVGTRDDGPPPDRILVVDHDAKARRWCREILEQAGITVLEARDGQEALEVLARCRVGLVVLEDAADRGELDLLARLRAGRATETLPVVLLGADGSVDRRVAGLSAGATDYLSRSVHPDELLARVRTHLRGRRAWARAVHQRLQERAAVGKALLRLRPSSTPEITADTICRRLLPLRHVSGAAVLSFTPDGGVNVLAACGSCGGLLTCGGQLPAPLGRALRERCTEGPWTERRESQPPGALGPPLGGLDAPGTAFAPLRSSETTLGLLAIVADPDAGEDALPQALATAIDFAHAVSALLRPGLEMRGQVHSLREGLRAVLRAEAFAPHYQPIVDLSTNAVAGHEVLTRFHDGTPPEAAFSEAAHLDMGVAMEAATMAAAVRDARQLPGHTWLAINVSPAFLTHGAELADLLAACDRPVVLELTEHDPITDYPRLLSALRRLGGHVRLSVDDAGAGYASLHHILELKPEYVKLDRGWIAGLDGDPARQALVAGLSFFAERTGSLLIAEGIETEAELAALRRMGIHLGQGWLLGPPSPV